VPTFGYLKNRVLSELKESEDLTLIGNRINDAVEALWEGVLLVNVQSFMQGPVQNIQIAGGSERATIVSINDPLVAPVVGSVAGGALPGGNFYFKYTYVTESGSETLPSPISAALGLAPNFFAQMTAPAVPALNPVGAVGYNVYASNDPNGRFAMQNQDPVGFSVNWTQTVAIVDDPDGPAAPLSNTTADNIYYIKALQQQNPDGTWTTWQGAEIDGLAFARGSRNLPVASTYQNYAWDVLHNNQLEIRPQAGVTLNPRYFYVVKPRRCRFDQAELPFANFAAEEFMVNYAMSRIKLGNEELEAHARWELLADKRKMSIMESLSDQNVARQQRVVPFMY
jgi:hypothetical protein